MYVLDKNKKSLKVSSVHLTNYFIPVSKQTNKPTNLYLSDDYRVLNMSGTLPKKHVSVRGLKT